jgi:long-chain acyl-CoA synthetase
VMSDPTVPTSLADIALRRAGRDASTAFVLTIDEQEPYAVRTRSYGQIVSRAELLTHALREAGVEPGERVGCYLPNSPSWVVASLGVWCTGAAVAAVGTLLPGAEAARLFDMADVAAVVTVADAPKLPGDQLVLRLDAEGLLEGEPDPGDTGWATADLTLPASDDLAIALFTSGTTGQPKGITHTHGDVVATSRRVAAGYARTSDYRPGPAPAHLAPGVVFTPFGHMAGYSRLGFRMWIGRPSVVVPRFTVPAVRALLTRFDMDTLQLTPTMLHMMANAEESLDLQGVKYVTSGTAPLSIDTRERFEERYGVPVMQAYGMSEVGAVAQERYDDVVAGRRGPGSVGRIAAGVEVKIRHLDDDRPGGEGEILVRTDEATTEFIGGERVPVDEGGWFATGDVGRMDDDILYITGRVQEKIIVGGFNVYPAEVEDVARRSALVSDAVVVGVPDERLGEVPVAGIVWAGARDDTALLEQMRGDLAHYKVPRALFSLERVPLTPRDKVDRTRAAEVARAELGSGVVEAREGAG